MRKKLKAFTAWILLLVMLLQTTLLAASSGPSVMAEKARQQYADMYDWDLDNFGKASWAAKVKISRIEVKPDLTDQYAYLKDLMETTTKYLGVIHEGGLGNQVVDIALAEEGTAEEGINIVKYNDWYWGRHVSGTDYAWCAVFVMWCCDQLDLLNTDDEKYDPDHPMYRHGGCTTLFNVLTNNYNYQAYPVSDIVPSGGDYMPVKGDLIFFADYEPGYFDGYGHVGFVVSADGNSLTTIEGNASDMVKQCTYVYESESAYYRQGQVVHIPYPDFGEQLFYDLGNLGTFPFTYNEAIRIGLGAYIMTVNPTLNYNIGTEDGDGEWSVVRFSGESKQELLAIKKKYELLIGAGSIFSGPSGYQIKMLAYYIKDMGLSSTANTLEGALTVAKFFCEKGGLSEEQTEKCLDLCKTYLWTTYSNL